MLQLGRGQVLPLHQLEVAKSIILLQAAGWALPWTHWDLSFDHQGHSFCHQGFPFGHQGFPFGNQGPRFHSSIYILLKWSVTKNEERTYELTDRTESRTMSVISIDEHKTKFLKCTYLFISLIQILPKIINCLKNALWDFYGFYFKALLGCLNQKINVLHISSSMMILRRRRLVFLIQI